MPLPAVWTLAKEIAAKKCENENRGPGKWLPSSFRSRDIEWTHRNAFKVPDSDAGRTHWAKMRSSSVRVGCAERVIKE